MPSLKIATKRPVNIGLIFQPPPQHKSSNTFPSTKPDVTPVKSDDAIPTDQTKFSTSTPTKSAAINILPSNVNSLEEIIDTGPSSESPISIVRTRSMSSIEFSDNEDTDLSSTNTGIIEELQILRERTWEYR